MVEELDRAAPDRQASWVALKTLRQRPTVVGRTDEGATVYEIRSERLVLPSGSAHFKRLVACAKCGREVPGALVFGPADLDHPAHAVFCDRCGRAVDRPMPEVQREREAPAPAPAGNAGDLERLTEQVGDLLRAQDAELAQISASVAELRAEMRELGASHRALEQAQTDLDQRLRELAAEVEARPGAALERVQQEADDTARRLDALSASADAGASRQHVLEQRIAAMAQELARLVQSRTRPAPAPGGGPVPGGILESLERQLRAAELRLQRTTTDAGEE